ncbi:membrane protein insertase YidC [Candidatus Peregrinibacteria bacterium]|jgi:YidC/Oxa1 family membrane protein insertase|nr:membrane protein insertase YidC [Candidatus Peregrinibacteria bacterium]MBT7484484.1 membrane protein insertase YidC [Candidatus Peregrinibacteria bacterium]MBT7702626.1 membrane protein insertase YidC [Candidatus Peregrinibacteria bacterium]
MKNKFLLWALVFLSIMLFMQNMGNEKEMEPTLAASDLGIATTKTEYKLGKEISLTLQNNTADVIMLPDFCGERLFEVYRYENSDWVKIPIGEDETCEAEAYEIPSTEGISVSYKNWAYRTFGEYGRYHIKVSAYVYDVEGEAPEMMIFESNEFSVVPRTMLGNFWLKGIYQPILNTMVFLIKVIPGNHLGFAIIILTLIIRTILLVPSQRAMRSQKRMQELQPKLEALKKKYKNNQEKLAMETMNLWKSNKVTPFGSCLPIFIQFPILIGLYYVVREGLHIDKFELLYGFVGDGFSFVAMNTNFLGILELMELNVIVLPLIVGGLQFIQMNLALSRAKKKKEANTPKGGKNVSKKVKKPGDMQDEMQMATSMMKYFMPVMIAFFTASMPAGVGLYWGTSTIYGIVQQLVVNKESLDDKPKKGAATVKVIEKKDK